MKYNVIPQIKHIKLNDGLSHFVNFYACKCSLICSIPQTLLKFREMNSFMQLNKQHLESLFLYWPSRSLTPGYQLSKMVRYSFAPWFKGGFHSARQFCFASKQNWTMSFAGKEARYFSSQHPPKQGFFFCQQEELGRKCPFVQCNAQSPLVFMAFTSWWIGRMRYKA